MTVFGGDAALRPAATDEAGLTVQLMRRDGFRDHIDVVEAGTGSGAWVPDSVAEPLGLAPGDEVAVEPFAGGPATLPVAGVYRDLRVERGPWWCSMPRTFASPSAGGSPPPPLVLLDDVDLPLAPVEGAAPGRLEAWWEYTPDPERWDLATAQRSTPALVGVADRSNDRVSALFEALGGGRSSVDRPASLDKAERSLTAVESVAGPVAWGTIGVAVTMLLTVARELAQPPVAAGHRADPAGRRPGGPRAQGGGRAAARHRRRCGRRGRGRRGRGPDRRARPRHRGRRPGRGARRGRRRPGPRPPGGGPGGGGRRPTGRRRDRGRRAPPRPAAVGAGRPGRRRGRPVRGPDPPADQRRGPGRRAAAGLPPAPVRRGRRRRRPGGAVAPGARRRGRPRPGSGVAGGPAAGRQPGPGVAHRHRGRHLDRHRGVRRRHLVVGPGHGLRQGHPGRRGGADRPARRPRRAAPGGGADPRRQHARDPDRRAVGAAGGPRPGRRARGRPGDLRRRCPLGQQLRRPLAGVAARRRHRAGGRDPRRAAGHRRGRGPAGPRRPEPAGRRRHRRAGDPGGGPGPGVPRLRVGPGAAPGGGRPVGPHPDRRGRAPRGVDRRRRPEPPRPADRRRATRSSTAGGRPPTWPAPSSSPRCGPSTTWR